MLIGILWRHHRYISYSLAGKLKFRKTRQSKINASKRSRIQLYTQAIFKWFGIFIWDYSCDVRWYGNSKRVCFLSEKSELYWTKNFATAWNHDHYFMTVEALQWCHYFNVLLNVQEHWHSWYVIKRTRHCYGAQMIASIDDDNNQVKCSLQFNSV